MTEPIKDKQVVELEKNIVNLEKELKEIEVEIKKNVVDQQKQEKIVEEKKQEELETTQKQIQELTESVSTLKTLNEQQMNVDKENVVYTVQLSDTQLDKLKLKETKYQEQMTVYFTVIIAILFGYIAIKGLLGKWKA